MRQVKFHVCLVIIIIAFYSCQKPVNLKATTTNADILVVEGLINAGNDITNINLSRTVIIGNKTTANPEVGATVTIEDAQATVTTLKEIAKGTYSSSPTILNLDKTKQYRLRVKTANGKTYLSDLVDVKITTPIDSIGYTIKNNGVQIYLNSHDDTNNSRYYLYSYAETWQFNAKYFSEYKSNGFSMSLRGPGEYVNSCYNDANSANILLNSTAALTQDNVYQFPLPFIEGTSEKISIKYSIFVTQTVLTKEAYAFWGNLRKSTESLGSIFDAQPSQLIGNIRNIADPNEPVIGYISAGTTQKKRIFINRPELPTSFVTKYPYACSVDTAKADDLNTKVIPNPTVYIPLGRTQPPDPPGFLYTAVPCGDCTIRGTLQKPAFW